MPGSPIAKFANTFMGDRSKDSLQRAFPLSADVVKLRLWSTRLTSPITWGSALVLVGLAWFFKWPWYVILGVAVVLIAALAFYWRLTGKPLEKRILKKLINESNAEQEDELAQRARALSKKHAGDLAITLGKFLKIKRKIEEEIHAHDELPEAAQPIETMVDELCYGVADELERLAQVEVRLAREGLQINPDQEEQLRDLRRELVTSISTAYKTLVETRTNLDVILRPVSLDVSRQKSQLDDVVHSLKAETEIARRVRQRLDEAESIVSSK